MNKQIQAGAAAALMMLVAGRAAGQTPTAASPQGLPVVQVPTVTVVAQKEPTPVDRVPASITVVSGDTLRKASIRTASDAAFFAPNTFYADLSARKVSNARFRGIGSSPANPAITTFVDGVPLLNTNAANTELLDVDQIEFVRGAQSALFGRNTLGGLVNVSSRRPSLTERTGRVSAPIGSRAERGLELSVGGPLVENRLAGSMALAYSRRDGFTKNLVTGKTFDDRSAFALKGQLLYQATGPWRVHAVVSEERDRDGDYTLGDLDAIRKSPFEVSRDFEGRTERDVVSAAVNVSHERGTVTLTSTTGLVHWNTFDETDLDYTPAPIVTRTNDERATQFTQEFRVASAEARELRFPAGATFRWQAGVFLFSQGYDQIAVNRFAPRALSPQLTVSANQHAPDATIDDSGLGLFGQGTVTLRERIDASVGLRLDRETRSAVLKSFFEPAVFPATTVEAERTFSSVSPQFSVTFRQMAGRTFYGSVGRGFKAGGFNPASPTGSESYDQEQAWHVEGGAKTLWMDGRVALNASVFSIRWTDLQLNRPNASVPGQFYIANVGSADSRGLEVDLTARVQAGLAAFAAFGFTNARFREGSASDGVNIADNKIPFAPGMTTTVGGEYSRPWRSGASLFARGEVVAYGAFEYDEQNRAEQDAFVVTNVRFGARRNKVAIEGWVKNLFDTRYVPVAFPYDPRLASSGFLGEPGRPRTMGVRVSVEF
jgi:iron complex outermembrane receptor protein